jgi:predicted RNase H-like nuclease (RuvC/YqgF family)
MAKVELDDAVIDKLVGKRVVAFKKTIRDLKTKLARRDNKVRKLEREVELLKADRMDESKKTATEIAKISRGFVAALERANWVEPHYECSVIHYADEDD